MALSRYKAKGRKDRDRFTGVPHKVMKTRKYISLNTHAKSLLFELAFQYNGHNNGDLSTSWTLMKERGFRSKSTLSNAIKQLAGVEFIQMTRAGGRNKCTLYALTWEAIDECNGKLDVQETYKPAGTWRDKN